MKKKILSAVIAASFAVSCAGAAIAADKAPSVYVDGANILFADQEPTILGEGTTLIPARGVFEAMGAKVKWNGETRLVEVTSPDNKTIIRLTIDDSTMKVFDVSNAIGAALSGQDFKAPEKDVTLEVAPQIINDRTMIPLRAISEALSAKVDWSQELYRIDITTADAPASKADCPKLTLTASSDKAAKDETVDLYINLDNAQFAENGYISGVTAAVEYDKDSFEFVSANLVNGDSAIENSMGASNADFADVYVKAACITIDAENAAKTNGKVMKLTFKSLNGNKGSFTLSNGYETDLGYNTILDYNNGEGILSYSGDNLDIDTTPVVVNAAD